MKFLMDNNHMLFIMAFVIALIILGVWAYMMVAGNPVPETLNNILLVVIGFFFGSQVTEMVNKSNNP